MDGLILPDVPFEEKEEFDTVCQKYGLDLVSLIAPTSHDRIRMIAKEANGFVYCVSSLGVTGVRSEITTGYRRDGKSGKRRKRYPVCRRALASPPLSRLPAMAEKCDGVIVGSAIVKLCGQYGKDCVPYVAEYVKSMKDAIR